MKEAVLKAEIRNDLGKGPVRRLRMSGKIPGIVYGKGKPVTPVSVDVKELAKLLREGASGKIIKLALEGAGANGAPDKTVDKTVIIKDSQRDAIKGNITHVDFQEVSLTEAITMTVPVVLVGEENRKSDGGILEHVLWELEIHALPTAIPEKVEIDVSGLTVGESIHVGDLKLPGEVKVLTPPEEIVVSVILPSRAEVEAPKPGAEGAEAGAGAEVGGGEAKEKVAE
ncbi:MAG: 50S ribosomal protein L25 [Firmicutes bacterium]|nr:50S ribosomal protein L25 [Bacillota bacterium]